MSILYSIFLVEALEVLPLTIRQALVLLGSTLELFVSLELCINVINCKTCRLLGDRSEQTIGIYVMNTDHQEEGILLGRGYLCYLEYGILVIFMGVLI